MKIGHLKWKRLTINMRIRVVIPKETKHIGEIW